MEFITAPVNGLTVKITSGAIKRWRASHAGSHRHWSRLLFKPEASQAISRWLSASDTTGLQIDSDAQPWRGATRQFD